MLSTIGILCLSKTYHPSPPLFTHFIKTKHHLMKAPRKQKKIRPKSLKEQAKVRQRKFRANKKERQKWLLMGDSNTEFVKDLIEQVLGREIDSVAKNGAAIEDAIAQVAKIKGYKKIIIITGANNPSLLETADAHSEFFREVNKLTSDPRRRMKLYATIVPKAGAKEELVAEKDGKAISVTAIVRRKTLQTAILLHGAVSIQPPINPDSYDDGVHVNMKFGEEIVRMLCKAGVLGASSW